MALAEQDSFVSTPLGQTLRIPCKFIEGKSDAPVIQVRAIAEKLKATSKNIVPVVIRLLGEDKYEAILNTQILDAARKAKLDFVWCIVVDKAMETQALTEAGEHLQVNINTATEQEITDILEYIKSHNSDFKKVDPWTVAQAIVRYRQTKKLQSLTFLTTLTCGVGKAKLPVLREYLVVS